MECLVTEYPAISASKYAVICKNGFWKFKGNHLFILSVCDSTFSKSSKFADLRIPWGGVRSGDSL